jgi:MFS family permease
MQNSISKESKRYKWEVLALLWVAFFLNQADRQIYNTLLVPIKESLKLTDAEAGLIATLFSLVFAVLVPLSGFIADRISRKWIIVFSIMLWSGATVISGACTGLVMFILFRSIATGMGEATFGPANYSTLADYHGEDTRGTAMSIHQTSYYCGVIVSGLLAGWIGEMWGWRSAFYIFGAIGVVHGFIIILRLRDKKSVKDIENAPKKDAVKFSESMAILFKTPTALILTIGFACLTFVLQGYLTWTPTFLNEKFGWSLARAGFDSMFYTHIAALIGILLAGRVSDKLARVKPAFRILMQSAGLLVAAPFIVLMGLSSEVWMVYLGLAGFGFARAFFDANTYPVLYDVIPPRFHASAAGVMLFLGFGVGSLSPLVLGILRPILGLSMGISILSAVWVFGSLLLFVGFKFFYQRDYERAHAQN